MTAPASTRAQALWFLDNLARIHVRAGQTGGAYGLVELTGARGDMPPLHAHTHDDECFYVLEGRMRLHLAGQEPHELGPGECLVAPRGVPHVYEVVSETARWLGLSNGGFEAFVEEVAVPAQEAVLPATTQGPSPEELTALAARHGIELLGPPGTLP